MKFREVFSLWINNDYIYYVRSKTVYETNLIYERYIDNYLGHLDISKINRKIIIAFLSMFEVGIDKYTNREFSNKRVREINKILNQTFLYALTNQIINTSPYDNIKINKNKTKNEIKILTKKDQYKLEKHIIDNYKTKPELLGILLVLYSGLRIGELCALTWDDIDLDNFTLDINKALSFDVDLTTNKKIITEKHTKTSHSVRKVIIPKYIISFLKDLKQINKTGYFIETTNNKRNKLDKYRLLFKETINKLNIEKINFHALRHTYATRAIESGMDVKTLSELMGHSSPFITQSIYIHISKLQMIEEIERYNQRLE